MHSNKTNKDSFYKNCLALCAESVNVDNAIVRVMRRLSKLKFLQKMIQSSRVVSIKRESLVRSGIRTHAQRTGLRPERSALDRSAILT